MSFLDQLKNKKQGADASVSPAASKPNPLAGAAKTNPLAGKPNPLTPKTAASTAPVIEESAEIPSAPAQEKKSLSFLTKKDGTKDPFGQPSAAVVPPAAESVQPVNGEPTSPVTEDASENASQSADIVADMKKADAATQEVESATQVEEQAAEPAVEIPATKQGKGGGRSGKGKSSETKPQAQKAATIGDETSETVYVDSPTTRVSYAEAVDAIRSGFVDPEWNGFQDEIEEELASIQINDDMHPGTLKAAIADLSKLRQRIWSPYQSTKTLFEQLSLKEPEGLIERVKKISLGDGSNDLQRKKAGVEACINYIDPRSGNAINLYELLDETRMRYNFLRATMDSIQFKTNVLITMNGALKLEKDHVGSET